MYDKITHNHRGKFTAVPAGQLEIRYNFQDFGSIRIRVRTLSQEKFARIL
jgi:hypothetical protein